ncbi:MAG: [ribosomal protein S18]-alanine N-acetyltransferase [Actinomycetota bacterium]|jgi:ribosomal-protein-alanine N-acetyltransferase|nr:ribosomal-protein-S18p-alanine acetyltransferase [Cryptosporangiaceae bacterium]MDQ1675882.1 [ribosomal protein S18]-alanine N-acetyltransferase [Actinomycetota bacterium]
MRWWHIDDVLPVEDELFGAERWTAGMFWSELAGADRWYLVALDGDELLGYAGLCVYPDSAWVQNIAVRRSAQGTGLGSRLLDALLAEAAHRGAPQVALEVAADNPVARHLYERRGFAVTGVRRGYYQPSGTDALVMIKEDL